MYSEYKSYVTLCTSWVKRSFASTKGALKTCNREWSKKFSMEPVHRNQLHKYFRMLFCKVYLQAYSIRQVLPPEDQFLKTDDFSDYSQQNTCCSTGRCQIVLKEVLWSTVKVIRSLFPRTMRHSHCLGIKLIFCTTAITHLQQM